MASRHFATILTASLLVHTTGEASEWPELADPPRERSDGSSDAAVVVGIEDYAFVQDIPGARENAVDWYRWLTESRGVPATRVHLLRDVEGTDLMIREAASRAASQVEEGGTLWFVFIGHGAPAQDGSDGLLVGADAQATAIGIYGRAVSQADLEVLLLQGRQERTVMVLDACFNGRTATGSVLVPGLQPLVPAYATRQDRVTVLSASKGDQFAGSLPGAGRPAFSYLALGGLRGWADGDNSGTITASEIVTYARETMMVTVKDRRQEPVLRGPGDQWVLGTGRERGPDITALVLDASPAPPPETRTGGDDDDEPRGLDIGSIMHQAMQEELSAFQQGMAGPGDDSDETTEVKPSERPGAPSAELLEKMDAAWQAGVASEFAGDRPRALWHYHEFLQLAESTSDPRIPEAKATIRRLREE